MRRRKIRNKVTGNIMNITEASILGGAGISAISAVGGETGAISGMTKFFPVVGSVMGAGMVLGSVSALKPKKTKKMRLG